MTGRLRCIEAITVDRRQRPEGKSCARLIITAAALAALVVPSAAMADVTDNKTTNDAQGYCIANHLHNGWSEDNPINGDHNGIGPPASAAERQGDLRQRRQPRPGQGLHHRTGHLGPGQQQQQVTPLIDPTSAPLGLAGL